MARRKKEPDKIPVAVEEQNTKLVVDAVKHIVASMSECNQLFWSIQAKKEELTLDQVVLKYVVTDFGLSPEAYKDFLRKAGT